MKPQASKDELRSEIEQQVRDYLDRGGAVKAVAPGTSGRDESERPAAGFRSFMPKPREQRTYLPDVIAAIEARRRKPKTQKARRRGKPAFVRRAVYDDFGEPVRWEWVETPAEREA